MSSASGELTSGRSARALVKAIARVDADDDADGAADTLLAWVRARRRGGTPPLIVVDEFDDLCEHVDRRFFQRLRGMIGEDLVVLLLATRVPLAEIGRGGRTSPFDNLLATEPVGLLDDAATDALIARCPDAFSAGEVAELHAWSGRHPYYVKLLAHHLIRARREGQLPIRKATPAGLWGRLRPHRWTTSSPTPGASSRRAVAQPARASPSSRPCSGSPAASPSRPRSPAASAGAGSSPRPASPSPSVLTHWLGEQGVAG